MKKIYIIVEVFLLLVVLSSCNKWLDLQPEGQTTAEKLFEGSDGYRSALNGLYTQMSSPALYGRELQWGLLGCMAQQYRIDDNYPNVGYRSAKNLDLKAKEIEDLANAIWIGGYNVIANANDLIQRIVEFPVSSFMYGELEKNMILGEAYAVRAYMHFDMLRLFAPSKREDDKRTYIPYIKEYPQILAAPVTFDEVIASVLEDLKRGYDLVHPYDTTDMGMSGLADGSARFKNAPPHGMLSHGHTVEDDFMYGRGYRFHSYAILAMMARVQQYAEEYDKAALLAQKILDAKVHTLDRKQELVPFIDVRTDGFEWASKDEKKDVKIISNLIFAHFNRKEYEDANIATYFKAGNVANSLLVIDWNSSGIFNQARAEVQENEMDVRSKGLLVEENGNSISAKWYPSNDASIRQENLMIIPAIRTTEMYYIIAESVARRGDFAKAYELLNKVRMDYKMWEPLEAASNLEDFMKDLTREVQREWIAEGQLFFFFKRTGEPVRRSYRDVMPYTREESELPIPITESI